MLLSRMKTRLSLHGYDDFIIQFSIPFNGDDDLYRCV